MSQHAQANENSCDLERQHGDECFSELVQGRVSTPPTTHAEKEQGLGVCWALTSLQETATSVHKPDPFELMLPMGRSGRGEVCVCAAAAAATFEEIRVVRSLDASAETEGIEEEKRERE